MKFVLMMLLPCIKQSCGQLSPLLYYTLTLARDGIFCLVTISKPNHTQLQLYSTLTTAGAVPQMDNIALNVIATMQSEQSNMRKIKFYNIGKVSTQ